MIRINLLPVRAARKKETARQQLIIFVSGILLVLLVAFFAYSLLLAKISGTKKQITQAENEIQDLKTKIGQIENLKKLQEDVKKKLDVLNQLRKGKTGPVERLAALSDATPDKLWLTKYTENGNDVSISGIAYSEELIAEFMRNLDASKQFFNVELGVSEQAEMGGVKVKRFDLSCKLAPPRPPQETKPQPAK